MEKGAVGRKHFSGIQNVVGVQGSFDAQHGVEGPGVHFPLEKRALGDADAVFAGKVPPSRSTSAKSSSTAFSARFISSGLERSTMMFVWMLPSPA